MDVFDLAAKITLDDKGYKTGLTKAKEAFSTAAKAISVSVVAAAGAVSAITKQAVDGYKEYEQLVGGVETLFGAGGKSLEEYAESAGKTAGEVWREYSHLQAAQSEVIRNAEKAYETAGLSANEYMNTVTSFSASLIQSVGGDTVRAAKLADQAIIDMSDNANKMGTSMEAIQNAYQGFAKQNYTMLDNLKLGYGGTKSEMERLLADAQAISGIHYDVSSYADVVEAIHVIQTEMGITGTTAREASETIEGSLNMAKAAWKNLLVAFGSGKDVKKAMKNFTGSVKTAVKNVIPVVKNALTGIAEMVSEIGPVIAEELPGLVEELLPGLLTASASLVRSVAKALPKMLLSIFNVVGTFMDTLGDWLNERAPVLGLAFDGLREGAATVFTKVADLWNNTLKPALDSIRSFVTETLVPAIKDAWEKNVGPVTDSLESAFDRISEALGRVKDALQPTIDKISDYVRNGDLAKDTTDFFSGAVDALSGAIKTVAGWIATATEKFADFVDWLTSGSDESKAFIAAITGIGAAFITYTAIMKTVEAVTAAVEAVQLLLNAAMNANPIVLVISAIAGLVAAFVVLWNKSESFRQFWIDLWDKIKEVATDVADKIKKFFTEDIPGAFQKAKDKLDEIKQWASDIFDNLVGGATDIWNKITGFGEDIINKIWEGLSSMWETVKGWAGDIFQKVKDGAAAAWDTIKGIGGDIIENIKAGIIEKWEGLKTWFRSLLGDLGSEAEDAVGPAGWVDHGTSGGFGHAAIGRDYVPSNNYPMMLHRGEAVLTRQEADAWRSGKSGGGGMQVNIYAQEVTQSTVDYIIARADAELGGLIA